MNLINENAYTFRNKKDGMELKIEIDGAGVLFGNNLTISGLTVWFQTIEHEVDGDEEYLGFYSKSGDLVAVINPVEWETLDHKEVKL